MYWIDPERIKIMLETFDTNILSNADVCFLPREDGASVLIECNEGSPEEISISIPLIAEWDTEWRLFPGTFLIEMLKSPDTKVFFYNPDNLENKYIITSSLNTSIQGLIVSNWNDIFPLMFSNLAKSWKNNYLEYRGLTFEVLYENYSDDLGITEDIQKTVFRYINKNFKPQREDATKEQIVEAIKISMNSIEENIKKLIEL